MKISFKGGPFMKVSFYDGLIFKIKLNLLLLFIFFMEVLFYGGLILLLRYPAALSVTVVFLRVLGTTFSISIAQVRTEPFQRFYTLKIVL